MSSEIILNENTMTRKKRVNHGPQHDLESFFWVLCWLATHFDMPGHMRAKEDIPEAVVELFDDEAGPQAMALSKKVFWNQNTFEEMAEGMTPYFRPLEDTLKSWMKILHVFYTETARAPAGRRMPLTFPQELLHPVFLQAFDGVVVDDDMDEQCKEAREVELERRRVDLLPQSASRRRRRAHRMDVDG